MNTIDQDIAQALLIADLHRGTGCEDAWNHVIERLAMEVKRLREADAQKHAALQDLYSACCNGLLDPEECVYMTAAEKALATT